MAVPTLITDLSTTAASNSPSGSENVFPNLDDYLRAQAAFLASVRDNSGNGWVSPYLATTWPAAPGPIGATTPSTIAGTTGTFSGNVQMASLNGGQLAGLRNKIINGDMRVAQRSAPTITNTLRYGQVDRFLANVSGGTGISGTVAQVPTTIFSSQLGLALAAASWTTGQAQFCQRIESKNVQDLNSKTITISCKIYQDTGGTRSMLIGLFKPTALDNWTGQTQIGGYTATSVPNATVTTATATFTLGATDATNGIGVVIIDSAANTVSVKNYYVGDVQLELGSVATPFEFRPIGMELALCQRYFEVLPQAGTGSIQSSIATGQNHTATSGAAPLLFKTTKRATPTLSNAGTFRVYAAAGADIAVTGLSYFGLGLESAVASYTVASGLVAGNATLLGRITDTSGQISISAEL